LRSSARLIRFHAPPARFVAQHNEVNCGGDFALPSGYRALSLPLWNPSIAQYAPDAFHRPRASAANIDHEASAGKNSWKKAPRDLP
jgi:hypothetical protein